MHTRRIQILKKQFQSDFISSHDNDIEHNTPNSLTHSDYINLPYHRFLEKQIVPIFKPLSFTPVWFLYNSTNIFSQI